MICGVLAVCRRQFTAHGAINTHSRLSHIQIWAGPFVQGGNTEARSQAMVARPCSSHFLAFRDA